MRQRKHSHAWRDRAFRRGLGSAGPIAAILLLFAAGPVPAAPEAVTIETEHYRLVAETSPETASEYGRVLETAWPHLREFFGAEPELEKDERLSIVFCATRESFARRLLAAGIQPPAAGGYYHLRSRTAFAWRQPTIYFTRCLLLHETIHQFHYLAKTDNRTGLAGWYAEGIAEFLSRHYLDGEKLTLGVVPMVTLEDSSRTALEALTGDDADLTKLLTGRPLSRPAACALVRWAVTADGGKHRKRFERLAKKLDRGARNIDLLYRTYGKPAKLRAALVEFLEGSQEPWSQIFNEWEGTAPDAFRGTAGKGIVSACRVKGDADRISAVLVVPEGRNWMAGLLLDHPGGKDYTTALLTSEGRVRVHRRRGGKWIRLLDSTLPVSDPGKTIRFEATRTEGKVRLKIEGKTIGAWELSGRALGLAIQGGVATFRDVKWGQTPADRRSERETGSDPR